MACVLFNICLSLFLEQDSSIGRLIALDEAHKYMRESPECQTLTNSLLETIRLQRHLGARVIISTQEPSISPKLLDLCSVTFVHRFTSPDWLNTLKTHIAAVSSAPRLHPDDDTSSETDDPSEIQSDAMENRIRAVKFASKDPLQELFSMIVGLQVGEALVFAPSAVISCTEDENGLQRLAHKMLKVRVRTRLTADGGKSIVAS
jgi:hypothetical protein